MTTVFGNPGSTELRMFRDWPDDFTYVLGLQESVAVGTRSSPGFVALCTEVGRAVRSAPPGGPE
ncbi:hypothetical protein [Streptomyces sp. NPDC058086]|uniref:hypothetical protein n=1 Tax=Streptomyces sp. NPDC058086 TaxID=3346334 RepID=UPI0036E7AF42